MKFSKLIRFILSNFLYIVISPLHLFIKKNNVIIFETSSHYRYAGSPKYLYEYLSANTDYKVYWLTESDEIKKYLSSKKLRYISNENIFNKVYVILQSKIFVGSGTSFHDPFFLISRDKNITKICTMHGSGPKLTIPRQYDIKRSLSVIKKINMFDYVSFCTSYASTVIGVNQMVLSPKRIKLLGAPKNDILFDKTFVNETYTNRPFLKSLFGKDFDRESKVVYYVPTFRPFKSKLPIYLIDGFDQKEFVDFLEKENIYFIYSDHPSSSFEYDLDECSFIKKIESQNDTLFDNVELMIEVDMLMGDYSTLSTDFSILRRPQLFIMPDYDKVLQTKGFAEDMRVIVPGKIVKDANDLFKSISLYISDSIAYERDFGENVDKLLERYIDISQVNSREKYVEFFSQIM